MAKDNAVRQKRSRFDAEAAYANSIFRSAIGDSAGCIRALERAIEIDPTYAPAVLSMGSVEYQRKRKAKGRKLLLSLVEMPDEVADLAEIIDKAGDFLIAAHEYADGLELYRAAARRFPEVAVIHQGRGCCAGHTGDHEEAVDASRRALQLEPDNQKFVNDLGWTLFQSGALQEARVVLERAVAMDPADELARENLRLCRLKFAQRRRRKSA